ncbi:MAG: cell division protein FtsA [Candidatus Harrisonbacteria bacterium]|nr:cell division protein FtsA [Candidatus Harrisonbacteria bacterium]
MQQVYCPTVMSSRYIVGLDIGSLSIKAVVCEMKNDGTFALPYATRGAVEGMRKGMVDDLSAVTRSVNAVLSDIRQIHKNAAKRIYLGIGTPNVRVQTSKGIVAVSRADFEIYKDDIARAIEAAESVKLPANRTVIHTLTDEFAVDDIADIKDPLGMTGHRLEAKAMIIDAFAPAVKNIMRAVEVAGGGIAGLILEPIASARAVFTRNQRELGTCLVDVGFGTTAVAVYQEHKLLHANVLPLGAGHVTNDLAIGLKTSVEAAEGVKLAYGVACAKDVPIRETVDIAKYDPATRGSVPRRYISEIVEVRLAEILEFIKAGLCLSAAAQRPRDSRIWRGRSFACPPGSAFPTSPVFMFHQLSFPAFWKTPSTHARLAWCSGDWINPAKESAATRISSVRSRNFGAILCRRVIANNANGAL